MAAPPLHSRPLSSTISRSIHGRFRRHLSSFLSLRPPPRRRSSHSEAKNPRNEKKQELSRLGLFDREGKGRLLRDMQPEPGDSSIQASKDGDDERLQSLAGEKIWTAVEDKGVGEKETHEDVKYSLVPSQEEIVHLIRCQKTPSQALETFRWASKIPKFCHSQSTYRALVRKLCAFGKFQLVHKLIEEMPHCVGLPPDDDLFIAVIRGFCHARKGRKVVRILDWVRGFGRQPSLKLFNAVLDVLVGHDIELARDFYREKMMGSGVGGDHFTFGILMKSLCSTNRIGEAFKLLAQMKSHGLQPNTVIYNMLIHSLCRNGKVGRGRSLMNEMVEPNGITFSILICEYCKDGKLIQALVMLEKCFSLGYVPNVVTVTKVVELLCTEGRGMEAAELLERVERMGGNVDVLAYNTLIKGFCMLGKAKIGEKLLKEMERKGCLPNVHTYKILIAGLCDIGNVDSALDLLHEMDSCGLNADLATYEMLIECLCRGGRTYEGLHILKLMENQHNLDDCMNSFNCIIYGFYRENKIDEAQCFISEMGKYFPTMVGESLKIFNLCKEGSIVEAVNAYISMVSNELSPNALVYVCLIHKLSEEGEMCRALELINEMVVRGYFPIPSTFGSLINGFCHRGQIESANRILDEMMKRDCSPNASCINPVIDYFCGKGEYNKACELLVHVTEKDAIPDERTWSSLLMNNEVELGQGIFESLIG